MEVRVLTPNDISRLKVIHEKFYKKEFEFPDFYNNFLSLFAIVDDNGDIITAGGIRTIAESIIITDKEFSVRQRKVALERMLAISNWVLESSTYTELHCFIQDKNWYKVLEKYGFRSTKGKPLVIGV